MKYKRSYLAIIIVVILIVLAALFLLLGGEDDDDEAKTLKPSPSPTVFTGGGQITAAILVIDVFDTRQNLESIPEVPPDANCLIAPDGQGHVVIAGAGHVVIAGASGTSSSSFEPHGSIVYAELESELAALGGTLDPATVTSGPVQYPNADLDLQQSIRTIETWSLPSGLSVQLVALDTEGYTTSVMADRIPRVVDLLYRESGVANFVLNMSFAIVPCSALTEERPSDEDLLAEYRQILAEPEYAAFAQVFEDLLAQNNNNLSVTINQSALAPIRSVLLRSELQRVTSSTYDPEDASSVLDAIQSCFGASGGEEVSDGEQATEEATQAPTPSAKRLQGGCSDPLFPGDPLFDVLLHPTLNIEVEEGQNLNIISIASAGNLGIGFPFAPGYYPSVVSVSAEYQSELGTLGISAEASQLIQVMNATGALASNAGEVQFGGLYFDTSANLVHAGTSFSAPKLSLEAALYLLNGGLMSCQGLDGVSSPPLAYPGWDNLPRADAASMYCDAFNQLVP